MTRLDYALFLLEVSVRFLLNTMKPYTGRVEVHVHARGQSVTRVFGRRCQALDLPPSQEVDPIARFSEEEWAVLNALRDGPLKGEVLVNRSKIERSRCYVILAQLQSRRAVDNDHNGYLLAVDASLL